jgi:hypothetical protein
MDGLVLYRLHQPDAALSYLERAVQVVPNDTQSNRTPITSKPTCFLFRPITASETKMPPNCKARSANKMHHDPQILLAEPEISTSGSGA